MLHLTISMLHFRFFMLYTNIERYLASKNNAWKMNPFRNSEYFSWSHPTKISAFGDKTEGRRKCWWGCKGIHLLLLLCMIYCTGRLHGEPFQTERQNERQHQDRSYWLFIYLFFACWFWQQIKTIICPPLKRDHICKWFSVDEQHLKNPEWKQRVCLLVCLFLLLGKKWIW